MASTDKKSSKKSTKKASAKATEPRVKDESSAAESSSDNEVQQITEQLGAATMSAQPPMDPAYQQYLQFLQWQQQGLGVPPPAPAPASVPLEYQIPRGVPIVVGRIRDKKGREMECFYFTDLNGRRVNISPRVFYDHALREYDDQGNHFIDAKYKSL